MRQAMGPQRIYIAVCIGRLKDIEEIEAAAQSLFGVNVYSIIAIGHGTKTFS